MGLLQDSDWKAKWIGLNDTASLKTDNARTILPARYLRKEFASDSKPVRAVLYVSAWFICLLYNGERVDRMFSVHCQPV
jgi:alpha-L-rhamnosidase